MPATLENLGENSFAAVIRRGEERAGSRANFCRETGFSEQNCRRWGDQGEFPKLSTIHAHRRDLPVRVLLELAAWLFEGTKLRITVADTDVRPVAAGELASVALGAMHGVVQLAQGIDAALADNVITRAERSNLQLLADAPKRELERIQLLACDVVAATHRTRTTR